MRRYEGKGEEKRDQEEVESDYNVFYYDVCAFFFSLFFEWSTCTTMENPVSNWLFDLACWMEADILIMIGQGAMGHNNLVKPMCPPTHHE